MTKTLIVKEVSDFIDGSVGTFVSYEGMRLLVVESKSKYYPCAGCVFQRNHRKDIGYTADGCYAHNLLCNARLRKDQKDVIFKLEE